MELFKLKFAIVVVTGVDVVSPSIIETGTFVVIGYPLTRSLTPTGGGLANVICFRVLL